MRGGALRSERGEIIGSWLVQMVLFMAVLGVLGYEVVSVVITAVNLDQTARDVATAAVSQYEGEESQLEKAEALATQEAERQGARLNYVEPDGDQLRVEVAKQAPTLFVHRIGALEDLTQPTARGRARWR